MNFYAVEQRKTEINPVYQKDWFKFIRRKKAKQISKNDWDKSGVNFKTLSFELLELILNG